MVGNHLVSSAFQELPLLFKDDIFTPRLLVLIMNADYLHDFQWAQNFLFARGRTEPNRDLASTSRLFVHSRNLEGFPVRSTIPVLRFPMNDHISAISHHFARRNQRV